jgi:hypothetical protein
MSEPTAWNQYIENAWTGGAIADDTSIAIDMKIFAVGWGDKYSGISLQSGFATIEDFSRFGTFDATHYVTLAHGLTGNGTAFTLRTWPRGSGEQMPGNMPSDYQEVILQTPDGHYLAADDTGTYHATAQEHDAAVLILDLTLGAETVLRPAFYPYGARSVMDPRLSTNTMAGKVSIQFVQPVHAKLTGGETIPGQSEPVFVDPPGVGPIVFQNTPGTPPSAKIGLTLLETFDGVTMPFSAGQRVSYDGRIYLVIDGELRWIPNPTTYDNLFVDWNNITAIAAPTLIYPIGSPLTDGAYLAQVDGEPTVYLVNDGLRRGIESPAVMTLYSFNAAKIVPCIAGPLHAIPEGKPIGMNLDRMPYVDGTRVHETSTGKFYLVIDQMLRWIPNPATYDNLFADWVVPDTIDVLPATTYRIGPPLTDGTYLAMNSPTGQWYLMVDGVKRWIVTPAVMTRFGFDTAKLKLVPPATLDIDQGADLNF